jgi:hypothetical protein
MRRRRAGVNPAERQAVDSTHGSAVSYLVRTDHRPRERENRRPPVSVKSVISSVSRVIVCVKAGETQFTASAEGQTTAGATDLSRMLIEKAATGLEVLIISWR